MEEVDPWKSLSVTRSTSSPVAAAPRWPAAVALLIVGALYAVISETLTFGPRAVLLALVFVLLVPLVSAHQQGRHRFARWLGFAWSVSSRSPSSSVSFS